MKRFLPLHFDRKSPISRYAAVLAATALYGFLFLILFPRVGREAALLAMLPVITVGWLFRRQAGLLSGLIFVLVNGLLFLLKGSTIDQILPYATGLISVTLIVIGGIVGRARELLDQVEATSARLENEVEDRSLAEAALQRALVKAEAANLAKSDFVSFVSHELRSPISAIILSQDLLQKYGAGQLNQVQSDLLNKIHRSAQHLSALVSDLTDVSRIETGQLYLDLGRVSAAEAIDDVAKSFHAQLALKHQTLIVDLPANLPGIHGDWMRLIQILTNLLSNAHKYTPAGGRIRISAGVVSHPPDNGQKGSLYVRISVEDNGIGIREEDQEKIFWKFYRVGEQSTAAVRGTGLGLAITRELVELQKGYVRLESQYQQGTTISFFLPAAEGQPIALPRITVPAD